MNSLALARTKSNRLARAALLLALDHHGDVERNAPRDRLVGAQRFDEGHELPLVVACAAPVDDLATVGQRVDLWLERRRAPQVQRIDRLHVIMAVEQHARAAIRSACAIAFGRDHRVPRGRADGRLETEARQVFRHMVGGGEAEVLVGAVGRNRRDAHQLKQAIDALVEIGIDPVEHGGQGFGGRSHRWLRNGGFWMPRFRGA